MNIFNPVILIPVAIDVVLLYVIYLILSEVRFNGADDSNGVE